VAYVIDNQGFFDHLLHHAFIAVDFEPQLLECLEFGFALSRIVEFRISAHFQLFNVFAVGIDLDFRQHMASFVVIAVRKFIACGHGRHSQFAEQILVVVGA